MPVTVEHSPGKDPFASACNTGFPKKVASGTLLTVPFSRKKGLSDFVYKQSSYQ